MSLIYIGAKNAMMTGALDLTTATLKVQCVDAADYTVDAAHGALDSIPAAARVGTPAAISGATVIDNVFDADNTLINNVTGDTFEAVAIYEDTGVESTSTLIAYLDNAGALSVTPNGADIILSWADTENKIFAL